MCHAPQNRTKGPHLKNTQEERKMIMSNLKKLAALVLALMMILSLTSSMASETELGSITINGISAENTYEIYKLLDLESYNTTSSAYSYTVDENWNGFFATEEAKQYFTVDENGYATWIAGDNADVVAAFAKAALAYAKDNGIDPVKSSENPGEFVITESSGKFTDLKLGYYLIDSTMGALCGLTTTAPNASIEAKNGQPTIDKQVKEDGTQQWVDQNSADIGQLVEFRTTIYVHAGAENYVLHDKMSAGLTFKSVDKIEHVVNNSPHDVPATKYTVNTDDLCDETCTFEIVFSKELCDELETNDKLIVYYTATVNKDAIIAQDGNPNEAWLDFGEDHHTTHDTTTTYTYGFDIVKTDGQNLLIDGAEFKIYDAETGGNEVPVVLEDGAYRRAEEGETGVSIVVKDGLVRVNGFDNGTYYLEETVTPAGYNQLAARQKFIISDGNLEANFNDGVFSTGSGVHVVNKTGSMLPETGGIGTTLFYVVGGVLVIAAVVLLITKKRMSNAE